MAPQTAWALALRNYIFAFIAWTRIVEFAQKYFANAFASTDKYPLPDYEWAAWRLSIALHWPATLVNCECFALPGDRLFILRCSIWRLQSTVHTVQSLQFACLLVGNDGRRLIDLRNYLGQEV